MANTSQVLEDALRYILTDTNLPSEFADFQALTRELIRRLSPYAVLVDRETYNRLTRPKTETAKGLEEVTARYKAHNDIVERGMKNRGSLPPMPLTTTDVFKTAK